MRLRMFVLLCVFASAGIAGIFVALTMPRPAVQPPAILIDGNGNGVNRAAKSDRWREPPCIDIPEINVFCI